MAVRDTWVARRGVAVFVAGVALALIVATPVIAAPQGWTVGGPPAHSLEALPEGGATTAGRVIGVGELGGERTQIDAYGWQPPAEDGVVEDSAACAFAEFGSDPRWSMYLSCFHPDQVVRPIKIESMITEIRAKSAHWTVVLGTLSPDVAHVVVSVEKADGTGRTKTQAVVAQVGGSLCQELGQSVPFGYFLAKVPHVAGHRPLAIAYTADGRKIGLTDKLDPSQF
jgi:hypothetical protein